MAGSSNAMTAAFGSMMETCILSMTAITAANAGVKEKKRRRARDKMPYPWRQTGITWDALRWSMMYRIFHPPPLVRVKCPYCRPGLDCKYCFGTRWIHRKAEKRDFGKEMQRGIEAETDR